jgi:hypothetical protein
LSVDLVVGDVEQRQAEAVDRDAGAAERKRQGRAGSLGVNFGEVLAEDADESARGNIGLEVCGIDDRGNPGIAIGGVIVAGELKQARRAERNKLAVP